MTNFIPYGRQFVDEDDIKAVVDVLRSDWLTTGPYIEQFEQAIADYVGVTSAVAVSNGTAALHASMYAIGIKPGDEVIVPPLTFAATANAIVFQGGTPVFADVEPGTLLINPELAEEKITSKTKAIIGVDYAGQPADYDALRQIAEKHNLFLVADACHSLGASDHNRPCGSLADLSVFSFHPVKPITTGEGGMVVTDNNEMAERLKIFRNHGITSSHSQRQEKGSWFYEMVDLGFNYRITDFQCALGLSQLKKLPKLIKNRRKIADMYDVAFSSSLVKPLQVRPDIKHGYHLYVVRVPERDRVFRQMRERKIGVNLHYIPVYRHPFYKKNFDFDKKNYPVTEEAYREVLSLPIYPELTDEDIQRVIVQLQQAIF